MVLPDGTPALAHAYSRYLAGCCRRFFDIAPALPAALRPAHAEAAALVREVLPRAQRPLLNCFASPTVSTPLQCLALRDDLAAFRDRIDAAAAGIIPHLLLEMALRGHHPRGALDRVGARRAAARLPDARRRARSARRRDRLAIPTSSTSPPTLPST